MKTESGYQILFHTPLQGIHFLYTTNDILHNPSILQIFLLFCWNYATKLHIIFQTKQKYVSKSYFMSPFSLFIVPILTIYLTFGTFNHLLASAFLDGSWAVAEGPSGRKLSHVSPSFLCVPKELFCWIRPYYTPISFIHFSTSPNGTLSIRET